MFKNIISPVQAWFISQGRCVGCGTSLKKGKWGGKDNNEEEVTCVNCGRIFLYNHENKRFRRAPITKIA